MRLNPPIADEPIALLSIPQERSDAQDCISIITTSGDNSVWAVLEQRTLTFGGMTQSTIYLDEWAVAEAIRVTLPRWNRASFGSYPEGQTRFSYLKKIELAGPIGDDYDWRTLAFRLINDQSIIRQLSNGRFQVLLPLDDFIVQLADKIAAWNNPIALYCRMTADQLEAFRSEWQLFLRGTEQEISSSAKIPVGAGEGPMDNE